jgi:Flp pilus assembly protein TadG
VRRDDDGTATLEMVILAPFLLLMLMLIIAFARYAQTENLVDQASRDAARAATAQNSRSAVPGVVDGVVKEMMDDAPSSCSSSAKGNPTMTRTAFGLPDPDNPLQIDSVTVTVRCTLDLSEVAPLPLNDVQITRTFTSPLDRYRGYR